MKALIDGDILVYRVGFSSQDISEGLAKSRMTALVNKLVLRSGSTSFEIFLTGSGNQFRHTVATLKPYKGNRKAPKPVHYDALRKHLIERFKAKVSIAEEADDVLGYTAVKMGKAGNPCVIISIDKDLLMIPTNHYNFVKGQYVTMTKAKARLHFYQQLVNGDSTDNIPGYGRGAKKLVEQLKEEMSEHELFTIVSTAYEERFGELAVDRLLEVGTLLWIRREVDQQWKPPSRRGEGMAEKRPALRSKRTACSLRKITRSSN